MALKQFIYPFINDSGVYRPKVPIIITNPIENISIRQWGILDTGADSCVFNKFIANETHHNLQGAGVESEVTYGVGEESVKIWKHTFTVSLLTPDQLNVAWSGKNSLIGCLEHSDTPPILGFLDFMEFLSIRFNYKRKQIFIEVLPG